MVALYKSGDPLDPGNYRGLSLLPALSKIVSAVFTDRLNSYVENLDILLETQSGFRSGYSTTDNLFVLDCLFSKYIATGGKLYCAYVDFKKAYDFVNRRKLLFKLEKIGISTKMIKFLKEIYRSVSGCIKAGPQHVSESFDSFQGLRQGENISCILFSLYVNDLCDYLLENGASQLMVGLLYLCILFFADDLAMLDKTPKGLQQKLNWMYEFCKTWDLIPNERKTKVMVFQRTHRNVEHRWTLNGVELEVVREYSYVGLVVAANGKWDTAKDQLAKKATRAIYSLCMNMKKFGQFDVKVMLKLFDAQISPILTYGTEIWGVTDTQCVELVASNYYRMLLGLTKNASVTFVRGELGRYSLTPHIYTRVIKFWLKLVMCEKQKASVKAYAYQRQSADRGVVCWAFRVKAILMDLNFGSVWIEQSVGDIDSFVASFKLKCIERDASNWTEAIRESSLFRTYRLYKYELKIETYLTLSLPKTVLNWIARLRGGLLRIAVNEGRWSGTPYENRICPICNGRSIEDERHILFDCVAWGGNRRQLIQYPHFQLRDIRCLFVNAPRDFYVALSNYLRDIMFVRAEFLDATS